MISPRQFRLMERLQRLDERLRQLRGLPSASAAELLRLSILRHTMRNRVTALATAR